MQSTRGDEGSCASDSFMELASLFSFSVSFSCWMPSLSSLLFECSPAKGKNVKIIVNLLTYTWMLFTSSGICILFFY